MPVQGNEFARNLVPNLMAAIQDGMQLRQMPEQMRRRNEQEELANKMQQMKLDYLPQQMQQKAQSQPIMDAWRQAQTGQAQANTNKMNANANRPLGGDVGNDLFGTKMRLIEMKKYYGDDAENVPEYKELNDAYNTMAAAKVATTQRNKTLSSTQPYRSLTNDAKKEFESQLRGAGIPVSEGIELRNSGMSLADIANKYGVENINDITPVYTKTSEDIKQEHQRTANEAEVKKLSDITTPYLAEVSQRIGSISPKLIIKMLQNGEDSADEVGKILAAYGLRTEVNAGRLKTLGVRPGVSAMHEINEKTLSNMGIPTWLVKPEMFSAMDKYTNEWIGQGVDAYTNSLSKITKPGYNSNKKDNGVGKPPFNPSVKVPSTGESRQEEKPKRRSFSL